MIPDIGIMIGFYIVTRTLSLWKLKDGRPNIVTQVAAVVTILVAIYMMIDLAAASTNAPVMPTL